MSHKYKNIFSPLTVKNMTLNNRIVMMPMGTNYGEQNGVMSFLHINYYEQRAKGGTGLIIVENASVFSPQGSAFLSVRRPSICRLVSSKVPLLSILRSQNASNSASPAWLSIIARDFSSL